MSSRQREGGERKSITVYLDITKYDDNELRELIKPKGISKELDETID